MSDIYDVIVLGLGAAGSATTYQVALQGGRVLGIDQFSPPHDFGSSHGESRITREATGEGSNCLPLLAIRSNEIWKDLQKQEGTTLFMETGCLSISSNGDTSHNHVGDYFNQTLNVAQKHKIEFQLLNAQEIRKRFPSFHVADDEYGFFEVHAGILNADECVRTNIKIARELGAEIHVNEKVTAFQSDGNLISVSTEHDTYACKKLIVCAGPWVPQFLGNEYSQLFHVTRQVLLWYDVQEQYQHFVPDNFPTFIWELQNSDRPIYGFPALNGVSGGIKVSAERFDQTTLPQNLDREVTSEEISETFKKYFQPFFKGLESKCVRSAACMYTTTPDAQFIVDSPLDNPNITYVSPCSGHGFKHSAALGEAIAQRTLNGSSEIDISEFSISRFDK